MLDGSAMPVNRSVRIDRRDSADGVGNADMEFFDCQMLIGSDTMMLAPMLMTDPIFQEGPFLELPGGDPMHSEALDGEDDDPIVVTGTRPKQPFTDKPDTDTGTSTGDGTGGGGGGGSSSTEPTPPDPIDCSDRKAMEAEGVINDEPDRLSKENAILIYRDANGQVQKSGVIQGGDSSISQQAIETEMNRLGIDRSQVTGIVHNHPYNTYGAEPEVNRYPSGGVVPGGDWSAADWFVNGGAGGSNGAGFSLYVVDTAGHMREFSFKDRNYYANLTRSQRANEIGLPDVLRGDGTTC